MPLTGVCEGILRWHVLDHMGQHAGMPKKSQKPTLSPHSHEARRLAVLACCDPRSLCKYLAGKPVWSTTAERIHRVLVQEGLEEERPPAWM